MSTSIDVLLFLSINLQLHNFLPVIINLLQWNNYRLVIINLSAIYEYRREAFFRATSSINRTLLKSSDALTRNTIVLKKRRNERNLIHKRMDLIALHLLAQVFVLGIKQKWEASAVGEPVLNNFTPQSKKLCRISHVIFLFHYITAYLNYSHK